jgi:DNA-binding IclR family transcriptional regulator
MLSSARRKRVIAQLTLARFTDNTIVDVRRLEKELAAIRKAGMATDNEEYLAGLVCVAAPVTIAGRIVACVAVHAPVARMSLERAVLHLPALRVAANALGKSFDD